MKSIHPHRKEYLPFGKPAFGDDEIAAVSRILRSGWVGMGNETISFEKELAAYLQVPHVITVNSCTSALFLALLTHGVGPGDEVICPSLTWCSTANAALYLGARPVFCDVDPETLCLTPKSVAARVSSKTKAVMAVHFGGLAVDVDELRKTLPPHIAIIEDAAHGMNTTFKNGKKVGASGNTTCFSFYANKNLSTAEGGALSLFDDSMADRIRSLRQHGLHIDAWKRFSQANSILLSPPLTELGYKMNYTDLQASLGRVQLRRQPEFHQTRKEIAKLYHQQLSPLGLGFQHEILDDQHARHLFVIKLPVEKMKVSRLDFMQALREQNIGASIHYSPLHSMPLYQHDKNIRLPNTDHLCERILTLPISASMTLEDAEYVAHHVLEIISK